jgi:hypothetical protein
VQDPTNESRIARGSTNFVDVVFDDGVNVAIENARLAATVAPTN